MVILTDSEHITVGNHPLVKWFMKGVYNQKPSLPRYKSVWDVSEVLVWLQKIDIDSITMKMLTLENSYAVSLVIGSKSSNSTRIVCK